MKYIVMKKNIYPNSSQKDIRISIENMLRKFIQNNNKVPSLLNRRWGKKDVRSITTTTCNHNIHICAGYSCIIGLSACLCIPSKKNLLK